MAITLDGSNGILSPDFEPSSSTTPTNGLFLPTTNALGFATNSTERLRLDASGNLGIGTTSPPSGSRLAISGGSLNFTDTSARDILWGTSSYVYITGNQGTGVLAMGTGSTERARIDSSGNLLVGVTSATSGGGVIQVSNGITFPATQSASSNANTLDDYEEGSWTPTLSALGGGAATTYNIRTGVYTKIGNLVWAYFYLNVAKGTLSGNLMVTGLPFTGTGTSGSVYPGAAFSYWNGLTNAKVYVGGYVTTGTASFELHSNGAATTSMGALAAADLGAGQNDLICQWCYAV